MSTPLDPVNLPTNSRPTSMVRLLLFASGAGLLSGVLAWLVGERTINLFIPKDERVVMYGTEFVRVALKDQIDVDWKNAIFAYAVLGGCVGICLGLAAGVADRIFAQGLKAGLAGGIVGVLLTAGVSAVVLPFYFHQEEVDQEKLSRDLTLPFLVHAGCWAAVGLAGGLAWGLGTGGSGRERLARIVKAGLGGLIGAVIGAVLYELIGGIGFPADKSGEPISRTTATRFLARVLVALGTALTAAVMAESESKRTGVSTTNPTKVIATPDVV